jgi:hypothetical protein
LAANASRQPSFSPFCQEVCQGIAASISRKVRASERIAARRVRLKDPSEIYKIWFSRADAAFVRSRQMNLKIATAPNPILRDNMRKRLSPLSTRNLAVSKEWGLYEWWIIH